MEAEHIAAANKLVVGREAANAGDCHQRRFRHALLRPFADAIVAFAVFSTVSAGLMSAPSSANPGPSSFSVRHETVSTLAVKAIGEQDHRPLVQLATTSPPANAGAVYRGTSFSAAWMLLAIAFSAIFAMNLAVVRHVRRAYARPGNRSPARKAEVR